MAGIAVPFAIEQFVPGLLVRCELIFVGQPSIELRGEGTDLDRLLVSIQRLRPMVVIIGSTGAVRRTQLYRHSVSAKDRRTFGSGADLRCVGRPGNVKRTLAKDQFEKRSVYG